MYLSSMDLQRPATPLRVWYATPSVYLTPHQREVFGHVPIAPAESELCLNGNVFPLFNVCWDYYPYLQILKVVYRFVSYP